MKLKRSSSGIFIQSAAISDLAFLLIIYFMVIAGFNINTGFLLNLPERDSTRHIAKEDLIRFEMDQNGSIIYEEQVIDLSRAENLIRSAVRNNPNIAAIITIDRQTRWQYLVSFVELVQDLQIDSFSFSMKKENQ